MSADRESIGNGERIHNSRTGLIGPRIAALPRSIRDELNRRLLEGDLSNYASLSQWLRKQGYQISRNAIAQYGSKLEHRLETVRMATEQARAVVNIDR